MEPIRSAPSQIKVEVLKQGHHVEPDVPIRRRVCKHSTLDFHFIVARHLLDVNDVGQPVIHMEIGHGDIQIFALDPVPCKRGVDADLQKVVGPFDINLLNINIQGGVNDVDRLEFGKPLVIELQTPDLKTRSQPCPLSECVRLKNVMGEHGLTHKCADARVDYTHMKCSKHAAENIPPPYPSRGLSQAIAPSYLRLPLSLPLTTRNPGRQTYEAT